MSRVQAGTRWRRLRIYYPSPGCRQGTILTPIAAWRRLPGRGGTWPMAVAIRHFGLFGGPLAAAND